MKYLESQQNLSHTEKLVAPVVIDLVSETIKMVTRVHGNSSVDLPSKSQRNK